MGNSGQSTLSRVLGVIAGVLIVILGVSCFFLPLETYGITGWLITFALIFDGIAKVMVWNECRKIGVKDTWALIGGVLSIALGLVMLFSIAARIAVDIFIAYVVAFWLLFAGVVRIVQSFQMRKADKELGTLLGSNWNLAFIVGIAMVVLGIFCVANPVIVMVTAAWGIGFALIAGGVGLITATV